jgi:hypothetical protein
MTLQEGWSQWKGDSGNYKERIKGKWDTGLDIGMDYVMRCRLNGNRGKRGGWGVSQTLGGGGRLAVL